MISDSTSRSVSRRRFLQLAGAGFAVGSLLAACQPATSGGSAGGGAPSGPPPSGPPPTQAPAAAPTQAAQAKPTSGAQQAPAQATGAAQNLKVGATISLTGRYAALGEQVKNGYELAFDDLNKAGPVNKPSGQKFTLEMNVLDNASDPNNTVQRLETFAQDGVLAYLGGAGSDLHSAGATVGDKNKTPYLGVAFALYTVHQKGLKYLFSPFPKSPDIAKNVFDHMSGLDPKPAKVALFTEQTDWGNELRELWNKEATSRGGFEVVTDEQYAPNAKDFSGMILKAKGANADAVLALPTPPDGIAIAKQMKELDYNAKYYYFIRAADGLNWTGDLGKDGDFFLNAPGWSPDLKFPGVDQLKQEHQARYGKSAEALTGAAYALVQVLFDAVSRSTKLEDRDALRDALAATDMSTSLIGPVKFNPDGTGQVITVFNQWQAQKQVLVWPKDVAVAPFQYPAKTWSER
jgi:branched-chain amino acid transport system substrate-binding protein